MFSLRGGLLVATPPFVCTFVWYAGISSRASIPSLLLMGILALHVWWSYSAPGSGDVSSQSTEIRGAAVADTHRQGPLAHGSSACKENTPPAEEKAFDMFSCCLGRTGAKPAVAQKGCKHNSRSKPLEHKFGIPRAELYSTMYSPVDEDVDSFLKAALPASVDRADIRAKLETFMTQAAHLPASGWVRPRDVRAMLRFLMARQGNVSKAMQYLEKSLEFRQQMGAECILRDCDKVLHEAVDPYWKPYGIFGYDYDGDPILWDRIGACHPPTLAKLGIDF